MVFRVQKQNHFSLYSRQRGVALVISLIILLVMTILGVQGMQTVTLEEKMTGNFRDRALAFEAAEAGLRAAEGWLALQTSPPAADNTGSNNVWTFGSPDISSSTVWSGASSATTSLSHLYASPKYVIEERGVIVGSGKNRSAEIGANTKTAFSGTSYSYRITVRGVGGTNNSVVYLQSSFEKGY